MPEPKRIPPTDGTLDEDLARVENLARLMDTAIRVPVLGVRIGLDGLLGLVPGVGDAATLLPAAYIIYTARKMGVPNDVLGRMIVNSGADVAIGTVPLLGDLFDIAFKSNRRNVDLLRRYVETQRAQLRPAGPARSAEPPGSGGAV